MQKEYVQGVQMCPMKGAETMYKKVLNIISLKTKYKCLGIVTLSVVTAVLASLWPVQLGKIYTNVSGGNISTARPGSSVCHRLRRYVCGGGMYHCFSGV